MADEVETWNIEEIPDSEQLYMRVHRNNTDADGRPIPGAFRNLPEKQPGSGMSTDWAKYATPEETRQRARSPQDNAVIGLECGQVRQAPGQTVEHTPNRELNNRAHTDVFGEKTTEVRLKLRDIYVLLLPLE